MVGLWFRTCGWVCGSTSRGPEHTKIIQQSELGKSKFRFLLTARYTQFACSATYRDPRGQFPLNSSSRPALHRYAERKPRCFRLAAGRSPSRANRDLAGRLPRPPDPSVQVDRFFPESSILDCPRPRDSQPRRHRPAVCHVATIQPSGWKAVASRSHWPLSRQITQLSRSSRIAKRSNDSFVSTARLLVLQLVVTWTFDPSESFAIRAVLTSPEPFSNLLDQDDLLSSTFTPPTNPHRSVECAFFCYNSIFQCGNLLPRIMNATTHHARNLA